LLQLRLLKLEILLAQWQLHDAQALLDRLPDPMTGALHLRWLVDKAEAASKQGQNGQAVAMLDEVDRADSGQAGAGEPAAEDAVLKGRLLRGAILARTNQFEAAEKLLSKTASQAAAAGDSFNHAAALVNLSLCKINEERFDESLEYSRPAMDLAGQAHADRLAAMANENAGVAYAELGDLDRAEEYHKRAIQQLREIGDLRSLAESMGGLGDIYMLRHEPSKSVDPFQRAVQIATNIDDTEDAGHWAGRVASAFAGNKDWSAADSWNQKAYALFQQLHVPQKPLFLMQNTALISTGRGKNEEAEHTYRELISSAKEDDRFEELTAHMHLGELLASQNRFQEANAQYDRGLAGIERTVSGLIRDDYRLTYYDLQNEFFKQYVDLLVTEGQANRALSVAEYSRARVLTQKLGSHSNTVNQTQPANFEQYAKRSGAVLLSYWLGPKRSFVWVVKPTGIRMHELPGEDTIRPLIREYQKIIEEQGRDPVEAELPEGERLSQMLLGPIRGDIAGAQRVIVVPDGELHDLNLETLPAAGGRRYWIEEVEISIAPSLNLLGEPPRRSQSKPKLLMIGAPAQATSEYPALPAANSEIEGIQKVFAGAEIHTGSDATPESFLDSDPGRFSLIHFAAHAEANPASPLDSAVILSKNKTGDGYKLYARDIADKKLSADLVTLSACRSAGARIYGGEGLVGFTWAFLESGAQAVIAGLWEVGDQASSRMMDELYRELALGVAPPAALREAKLSLLRTTAYRKPFYWAPYQAYIR
jgi:CHAT domain-containing protein